MITAVVDQGNTRIKVAIFEDDDLRTMLPFSSDDLRAIAFTLREAKPESILYAASGKWDETLLNNIKNEFSTVAFDETLRLPFDVQYNSRKTVGTDRLANVAMAQQQFPDQNAMIIDMGTCITYDLLVDGAFVGGAISPGLLMRAKAMNTFTARLPEVEIQGMIPLLGNSTTGALQSGTYNGWHAEIHQMAAQFNDEFGRLKTVFTGGDLNYFEAGLKSPIFADPYWTLKGFNQILKFNAH